MLKLQIAVLADLYLPKIMISSMRIWLFILVNIAFGCQNQPHSNHTIYSQKDDQLDLQGKVDILKSSASKNDDALLASIALLYAQNKNWPEAKESISKAIKLNPLDASYHLYLANYNAALNDNLKAYNEAKVAFELGAYDRKLEALIAKMVVETGDTIGGTEFVFNYYQANKINYDAQLIMARWYLLQNKYGQAEDLLSKLLLKDSMNIEVLNVAYGTYLSQENIPLAIKFGNKLLNHDSTNASIMYQLAKLYEMTNEFELAARYFTNSYAIQPEVESILAAYRNYANLEMLDSVLYYSDSTFLTNDFANSDVLLIRARAFDKKYKYEESYAMYERLVKIDSTNSVVNAEQEVVQRKIAYLQRRKREKKQLADSLANAMPIINF